jgi:UDP-N-acetylmuramyl tripeptide synthase
MAFAEGLGHWDKILTPHPFNRRIPVELEIPVIFAIDPKDFTAVLANTFYSKPSERMITVGVTGSHGKSTVAWIVRSILEQANLLTGMASTIEDAIAADRLTMRGEFWEPEMEDVTFDRDSTSPFSAAPYAGKYSKSCTTPDHIAVCTSD